MFDGQSTKRTPWAVYCPKHGQIFLTREEYNRQLMEDDYGWTCPLMCAEVDDIGPCGRRSEFDDDNYETADLEVCP